MKRLFFLLCLVGISLCTIAQQCPPEWIKYDSKEYFSDVQNGHNDRGLSEVDFKNYLVNTARASLAKQIQVRVREAASLNKQSTDGRTSISYASSTQFSTDVNLKLVETKALYDAKTKEGVAIAYINKDMAANYYQNEINILLSKVENARSVADSYIEIGFKNKAKEELENKLDEFKKIDDSLFWLNMFGYSATADAMLQQRNDLELSIRTMLADLQYATKIMLVCSTDLFGEHTTMLQNDLKGKLASHNCSFVTDASQADLVISILVSAREYNQTQMNNLIFYFSYVDAQISVDKTATAQCIYQDAISIKGGHTLSYRDAARVACKDLSKKLGDIITKNIQ